MLLMVSIALVQLTSCATQATDPLLDDNSADFVIAEAFEASDDNKDEDVVMDSEAIADMSTDEITTSLKVVEGRGHHHHGHNHGHGLDHGYGLATGLIPAPSYSAPLKSSYGVPAKIPKATYGAPPKIPKSKPKPAYGAPKATYGAPKPSYAAPQPSYPAPKPVYAAPPKAAYGPPPQKAHKAPRPSDGAPPKSAYAAPTVSYSPPEPQYSAPTISYSVPPQVSPPTMCHVEINRVSVKFF